MHIALPPLILLGFEDDQVQFRKEEEYQDDVRTGVGRHAQREDFDFDGEINGSEGQPDDASGVHGKADEFRFCKAKMVHRTIGRENRFTIEVLR